MKKLIRLILLLVAFNNLSYAQKNNYKIIIKDNFLVIDKSNNIKPNEISFYLDEETKIEFELKSFPRILGKIKQEEFEANPEKTISKFLSKARYYQSPDSDVYFEFNSYNGIFESEVVFYTYRTHLYGSLPVRCSYDDGYFNLTIYSNDIAIINQNILIKNKQIIKID
jgi:hypothetical protein